MDYCFSTMKRAGNFLGGGIRLLIMSMLVRLGSNRHGWELLLIITIGLGRLFQLGKIL